MKKFISTIILFAFLANVSAQLKVNSAGQVGIGTASPQYKLDINGNARVTGDFYLGSTSGLIATTGNVPVTFKVSGALAGYTGSLGKNNVSFGYGAFMSNTVGFNTTGDYNTAIGYYAGVDAGSLLNNTTAIGYYARATSSNQVRIGNSSVTEIGGAVAWSIISDKRTKKNIRPDVPGLAFINLEQNNRLQAQNDRLQAQIDELSATVRQLSGKSGNANDFNGTGGE